jgi:hypothetical protein
LVIYKIIILGGYGLKAYEIFTEGYNFFGDKIYGKESIKINGKELEEIDCSPLHLAVCYCYDNENGIKTVDFFLKIGANPFKKDLSGKTPLFFSESLKIDEILNLFKNTKMKENIDDEKENIKFIEKKYEERKKELEKIKEEEEKYINEENKKKIIRRYLNKNSKENEFNENEMKIIKEYEKEKKKELKFKRLEEIEKEKKEKEEKERIKKEKEEKRIKEELEKKRLNEELERQKKIEEELENLRKEKQMEEELLKIKKDITENDKINENEKFLHLKEKGNDYFTKKLYNEAISLYTECLKFKKDPIIYSNRAASYLNLKK